MSDIQQVFFVCFFLLLFLKFQLFHLVFWLLQYLEIINTKKQQGYVIGIESTGFLYLNLLACKCQGVNAEL